MENLFKPNIEKIIAYEPGRPIEEVKRELGLRTVTKLASNENPLGASPKALNAMQKALKETYLYPDGASYYLKRKLSEVFGLPTEQFVVGNGSNEIIELLARGFLSDGDNVISSEKSFFSPYDSLPSPNGRLFSSYESFFSLKNCSKTS